MKLRVLDLFSGIGGFSLGLERTGGFETVAFCEIEEYPRKVLAKHWPGVPIYNDVREIYKTTEDCLPCPDCDDMFCIHCEQHFWECICKGCEELNEEIGPIDVITAGYPCQPFSLAGQRGGQEDNRHLWPEVIRVIRSTRPRWFIGENVTGHISMGLDKVLLDLEEAGYSWEAFVVPACAIGSNQRRDRVWIIANFDSERLQKRQINPAVARKEDGQDWWEASAVHSWREPPPDMVRVADGIPRRVDRIKALGNAVVPQIPELIGRAILEAVFEYNQKGEGG